MKLAIFINGFAESGKDETVKQMTQVMGEYQFAVSAVSSIDPIRNMLRAAGYDVDNKTPEMRALLAEVGDACEKFDGTKTAYAVNRTTVYLGPRHEGAVFVHVREPAMIEKMFKMLPSSITPVTVLIRRPGKLGVSSNKADSDVMSMSYMDIIDNDGTVDDLRKKCNYVFTMWRMKYDNTKTFAG